MTQSRLRIRRLIAFALVLGFGFFNAESLIADVCDGDSGLAAVSIIDGADRSNGSGSPAEGPEHTMHVCHCIHAHGGMPAPMDRVPPVPEAASSAAILGAVTQPNPALELQLRPPIA